MPPLRASGQLRLGRRSDEDGSLGLLPAAERPPGRARPRANRGHAAAPAGVTQLTRVLRPVKWLRAECALPDDAFECLAEHLLDRRAYAEVGALARSSSAARRGVEAAIAARQRRLVAAADALRREVQLLMEPLERACLGVLELDDARRLGEVERRRLIVTPGEVPPPPLGSAACQEIEDIAVEAERARSEQADAVRAVLAHEPDEPPIEGLQRAHAAFVEAGGLAGVDAEQWEWRAQHVRQTGCLRDPQILRAALTGKCELCLRARGGGDYGNSPDPRSVIAPVERWACAPCLRKATTTVSVMDCFAARDTERSAHARAVVVKSDRPTATHAGRVAAGWLRLAGKRWWRQGWHTLIHGEVVHRALSQCGLSLLSDWGRVHLRLWLDAPARMGPGEEQRADMRACLASAWLQQVRPDALVRVVQASMAREVAHAEGTALLQRAKACFARHVSRAFSQTREAVARGARGARGAGDAPLSRKHVLRILRRLSADLPLLDLALRTGSAQKPTAAELQMLVDAPMGKWNAEVQRLVRRGLALGGDNDDYARMAYLVAHNYGRLFYDEHKRRRTIHEFHALVRALYEQPLRLRLLDAVEWDGPLYCRGCNVEVCLGDQPPVVLLVSFDRLQTLRPSDHPLKPVVGPWLCSNREMFEKEWRRGLVRLEASLHPRLGQPAEESAMVAQRRREFVEEFPFAFTRHVDKSW